MDVGTPIHYFAQGAGKPAAAVVLEVHPQNCMRVGVMPKHGGPIEVKPTVYHKDDPRCYDQKGDLSSAAIRYGYWDYHPMFRPDEPLAEDAKAKIIEWAKNYDFESVCRKARSLGMRKTDIQIIYEEADLSVA